MTDNDYRGLSTALLTESVRDQKVKTVVYVSNNGHVERHFTRPAQALKFVKHLVKKGREKDILSCY